MSPNKVFGIGMSKTGTTTLGACLEVLGFTPHIGFDPSLKRHLESGGHIEKILDAAANYRAFEDSPWYHLYKELDAKFPGSKFILTVRKSSEAHAKSSWSHGVRRGQRSGEMTDEYFSEKVAVYENHNNGVIDYFKDRPDDLLILCWENGDGWEKLCSLLGVPVPDVPIPHQNQGRYKSTLPKFISASKPYMASVRALHRVSLSPIAQKLKQYLQNSQASIR